MWVCFCLLQKPWVCHLTLTTIPSYSGLIPKPHPTISLIAGSVKHACPHQWKASHHRCLHFRERTFSVSVTTFDNSNHMWCLFLIWWHLTILKWTGVTLCTLTMDIMWLLTLIILYVGLMTILLHIRRQISLDLMVFCMMFIKYGSRSYG